MKTYRQLSQKECSLTARRIADHAKSKWDDARALARMGSYASAVAFKIIALEEMAKALVLEVDAHGFRFRKLRYLKILDKNHRQRHFAILLVAAFDVLGESMKLGLKWMQANQQNVMRWSTDKEQASKDILPLIFKHYQQTLGPAIIKVVEWASILGDIRTDATYSDYRTSMHSPMDLTKQEYVKQSRRLDSAYTSIRRLCRYIKKSDRNLEYGFGEMQKGLSKPGAYKEIDAFIALHFRDDVVFDKLIERVKGSMEASGRAT